MVVLHDWDNQLLPFLAGGRRNSVWRNALPVSVCSNPEVTNLDSYSIRDNLVMATPGSKGDKEI